MAANFAGLRLFDANGNGLAPLDGNTGVPIDEVAPRDEHGDLADITSRDGIAAQAMLAVVAREGSDGSGMTA